MFDAAWIVSCLQAAVPGSDWISQLSSCPAPTGSFLHQERWTHGLRSRQNGMYRYNISDQSSTQINQIMTCLSLIYASAQVTRRPNFKEMSQDYARCQRWLNKKRFKAFYTSVFADNLRHGTQFLLQVESSDCTQSFFFSSFRPFKVSSSFLRRLVWVVSSQTRWSWVSRTTGGMGT